ncbi:MAG: hypothetical protein K2R98_12080 [Gemmataceae bacterium]|nr:hypothetical protein [Gemmataceae bacterium]
MQTVNFQCGHCHKVMGVSSAFLGKQVRCPHCQQVVMAPAQAPAPAAAPTPPRPPAGPGFPSSPPPPGRDEHESIFGEHIDEDLFGSPPKPMIDMPPEPARGNMQLEPTVFNAPGLPPMPELSATAPAMSNNAAAAVSDRRPGSVPQMAGAGAAVASAPGEWSGNAAPEGTPGTLRSNVKPTAGSTNMMLIYSLIGVSAFALLMMLLAIKYAVAFYNAPRSPMEQLPDTGDPKASKANVQVYRRIVPTSELPPNLITELGKPIKIGDLEVTPKKVEQKRVTFRNRLDDPNSPTAQRDTQEEESLVLHLDFTNVSKGTQFRPTDAAFDYQWRDRTDSENIMPYTFLTVNGIRYCGAFPRLRKDDRLNSAGNDNLRISYIEGQEQDRKILKPGESSSTVIVTEPKDPVTTMLRAHKGKLLWRVHLRRGLVKHDDKDVSATAVIGVEFDKEQIQKVEK